ncbi:ferric uptake regulation protein [Liquorilactobacillus ghanensis DSM 18630]|uniref:Ferric uptake regulation protein n=1 Tax=Liquorilactobacillus ghanensis DSM 18630 TaxID=1423750 RepID=A0A0R1VS43_9LACO|nr:ferric uptake regulation protein [Liquorilactobacillus ghanensis DSM 18630]
MIDLALQSEELSRIEKQLHQAGLKLTPQRRATVKTLLRLHESHLSAEELFAKVKEAEPDIGLATVYRTLEVLAELRIVNRVSFEDGITRYDLRTEDSGHFHHHLLCQVCGRVEEIHEDLLLDVEQKVEQDYGFKVADHRLTFLGICAKCRAKQHLQ